MSRVQWQFGIHVKRKSSGRYLGRVESVDEDGYHTISNGYRYKYDELAIADTPVLNDPIDSQDLKADRGKLQWSLVMHGCQKALLGVVKVMTIAITPKPAGRGYAKDSWKIVPEAKERYKDALYRHMAAIERGEVWDDGPEGTGCLHADCLATNALFLSEFAHGEYDAPVNSSPA